jgi:hypothetical protein
MSMPSVQPCSHPECVGSGFSGKKLKPCLSIGDTCANCKVSWAIIVVYFRYESALEQGSPALSDRTHVSGRSALTSKAYLAMAYRTTSPCAPHDLD